MKRLFPLFFFLVTASFGGLITGGGSGGGGSYTAPTGTGFSHNTSGAQDSASVAETGTGSVVRATSPALVTPTGIVKGDIGLGNVDNTSDATKQAASATLTNKTIDGGSNTITGLTDISAGVGVTVRKAVTGVNLLSAATSTIYTPTANFCVLRYQVLITAVSGTVSTHPAITFHINGTTSGGVFTFGASTETLNRVADIAVTNGAPVAANGNVIDVQVSTAGTGFTTLTATVILVGYYL